MSTLDFSLINTMITDVCFNLEDVSNVFCSDWEQEFHIFRIINIKGKPGKVK